MVKDGVTRRGAVAGLVAASVAPHVDAAELAASTALAASNFYGTAAYGSEALAIVAGETATAVGGLFSVDDGGGNLIYRERTAGGSIEVGRAITPSALSADDGGRHVKVKIEAPGSVPRTILEKADDMISARDFGAVGNGLINDTPAFLLIEALDVDDIYLPAGSYPVVAGTVLTKRFYGPGKIINHSGAGPIVFAGVGLNDLTLSGAFVQSRPLEVVLRVKLLNQEGISGAPDPCDTFEYSLDGGATWVGTYDAYNPVDDQVYALPLGMNAQIGYTLSGPVGIPGTGIVPVFASATGHTIGNTWTFTLRPNPQVLDTQSGIVTKNGSPIMGVNGVLETNTFLGEGVFGANKNSGNQNTAIGWRVMFANKTGYANTAIGNTAMESNISGKNNTAIGANALFKNTTGSLNTAVGIYAGQNNTTGDGNVSMGSDANAYNATGNGNAACGTQALYHNSAGLENAALGLYALRGGDESFGNGTSQSYCSAVGAFALYRGGGQFNAAIGYGAGLKNTGAFNTFLGAESGAPTTTTITGGYNVFIGYRAGTNSGQSGGAQNCVAIGDGSYTTGDNAVAIGSGVTSPANIVTIGNPYHSFVRPSSDNGIAIGGPSNRWTVVHAATDSISTSDEREKHWRGALNAAEIRAGKRIIGELGIYQWIEAVTEKGENGARYHIGPRAQRAFDIMESEGLDWRRYAWCCYDAWADQTGPFFDDDRNPTDETQVIVKAGDRYGIRADQLAFWLIAVQAEIQKDLDARLSALEQIYDRRDR